jgi:hypothetical protein
VFTWVFNALRLQTGEDHTAPPDYQDDERPVVAAGS